METHNKKRTPIRVAFGACMRVKRFAAGLSQFELAQEAGLHHTYVSSVERGERNLGLENIYALAKALKCKASELLPDGEFTIEQIPVMKKHLDAKRIDNLQFQVDILMDMIKQIRNDAINTI